MQKILTTINKFNGNFCFAAATDSGDVVVECDWQGMILSYDFSSKPITDIYLRDEATYYVAFSNTYIGKFYLGVLDETFLNTGISNVDKILINASSEIYILDKIYNYLYKYNSGIVWSLSLPDYSLRSEGNIVWRESDGVIVYNNNSRIYVIRDDTTMGTMINSLSVGGSGTLNVLISNEHISSHLNARVRMVSGGDLDQSSSSSSSSSSNSSSSSSSNSSSSSSSNSSLSSSSVSSNSSSSSTEIRSSSSSSLSSNSSSSNSSSSNSSSSNSSSSSSTEIRSTSSSSSSSISSSSISSISSISESFSSGSSSSDSSSIDSSSSSSSFSPIIYTDGNFTWLSLTMENLGNNTFTHIGTVGGRPQYRSSALSFLIYYNNPSSHYVIYDTTTSTIIYDKDSTPPNVIGAYTRSGGGETGNVYE